MAHTLKVIIRDAQRSEVVCIEADECRSEVYNDTPALYFYKQGHYQAMLLSHNSEGFRDAFDKAQMDKMLVLSLAGASIVMTASSLVANYMINDTTLKNSLKSPAPR